MVMFLKASYLSKIITKIFTMFVWDCFKIIWDGRGIDGVADTT